MFVALTIELAPAPKERQDVSSRAAHSLPEQHDRPSERQQVYKERTGDLAGPVRNEDPHKDLALDPRGDIGGDRQQDGREGEKEGSRRVRWSEVMSPAGAGDGRASASDEGEKHNALQSEADKPAPLVPAITRHDRSIEDVAREKAMPVIDQRFDTVESVARHVFRDPAEVAGRLRTAITEKQGNGKIMAKAMAEQPERFGELRGKSGLLGDNKERKAALHYAKSVSAHIGYVSEAWERRLGEERKSEQWQREKRDVIEVPGLTPRSAEIIAQVEKTPVEKRGQFIAELRSSPDGQTALEEAKRVANALTQRFGDSDPRSFAKELEKRPELAKQAEQIKTTARMVDRTRMAELTHDHTLKQQLTRSQGLGLSR